MPAGPSPSRRTNQLSHRCKSWNQQPSWRIQPKTLWARQTSSLRTRQDLWRASKFVLSRGCSWGLLVLRPVTFPQEGSYQVQGKGEDDGGVVLRGYLAERLEESHLQGHGIR